MPPFFHRTSVIGARDIMKSGFVDREWDLGVRDARSGDEVSLHGVWLADRPVDADDGFDGDCLLEVRIDAEPDELAPFELEGLLWDARCWVVPAAWLADRATARIAAVDPRSSGFFDLSNEELEID